MTSLHSAFISGVSQQTMHISNLFIFIMYLNTISLALAMIFYIKGFRELLLTQRFALVLATSTKSY
jgi:hypothetical protein